MTRYVRPEDRAENDRLLRDAMVDARPSRAACPECGKIFSRRRIDEHLAVAHNISR